MPQTVRPSVGDMVYHVVNRGNERAEVFHKIGVDLSTTVSWTRVLAAGGVTR